MNGKHISELMDFGFDKVTELTTDILVFEPELRKYCKKNICKTYCRSYSCPPVCGTPEDMKKQALRYKNVLVLYKIMPYVTNADYDRIQLEVRERMNSITEYLIESGISGISSAPGACRLCKECGAIRATSCPHPEHIAPSISAYCINAKELAKTCNMEYNPGENKAAFFCLYFFNKG